MKRAKPGRERALGWDVCTAAVTVPSKMEGHAWEREGRIPGWQQRKGSETWFWGQRDKSIEADNFLNQIISHRLAHPGPGKSTSTDGKTADWKILNAQLDEEEITGSSRVTEILDSPYEKGKKAIRDRPVSPSVEAKRRQDEARKIREDAKKKELEDMAEAIRRSKAEAAAAQSGGAGPSNLGQGNNDEHGLLKIVKGEKWNKWSWNLDGCVNDGVWR